MAIDAAEVALLAVHGNGPNYDGEFALAYPWPELQLRQIRRFTAPGYRVVVFGNGILPEHAAILRAHPEVELHLPNKGKPPRMPPWALRNWLVRQTQRRFRYLVMLDSDAFPIAPDWLPHYLGMLDASRPLLAVQRLENKSDFSHPSFMAFTSESWREHRFDYSPVQVRDAGAAISAEVLQAGLDWHRLLRSNRWNPHPLTAGIYDNRIYHHGAGSRLPKFRVNKETRDDEAVWQREVELHRGLMDLLFSDCDGLMERLRGEREPLAEDDIRTRGRKAMQRQGTPPAS